MPRKRVRMFFTFSSECAHRLREMRTEQNRPMSRIVEDLIMGVQKGSGERELPRVVNYSVDRELRRRLRELGIMDLEIIDS